MLMEEEIAIEVVSGREESHDALFARMRRAKAVAVAGSPSPRYRSLPESRDTMVILSRRFLGFLPCKVVGFDSKRIRA